MGTILVRKFVPKSYLNNKTMCFFFLFGDLPQAAGEEVAGVRGSPPGPGEPRAGVHVSEKKQ